MEFHWDLCSLQPQEPVWSKIPLSHSMARPGLCLVAAPAMGEPSTDPEEPLPLLAGVWGSTTSGPPGSIPLQIPSPQESSRLLPNCSTFLSQPTAPTSCPPLPGELLSQNLKGKGAAKFLLPAEGGRAGGQPWMVSYDRPLPAGSSHVTGQREGMIRLDTGALSIGSCRGGP